MKAVLSITILAAAAYGQQIISTFAGTQWVFPPASRPALDAPLSNVFAVAVDNQGRTLIADWRNSIVARIETSGVLSVVAGNGVAGFSGDGGDATQASLNVPTDVTCDRQGNIYIVDNGNARIRRVTPQGIISTYAGSGSFFHGGDGGAALRAGMNPFHISSDAAGVIYFTDYNNARVRRIGTDGVITTIAGTGSKTFSGEGRLARDTSLSPWSIAVDTSGRAIVSDPDNLRVYRIGTDGILQVFAGSGVRGLTGDGGPARDARLSNVEGVAVGLGGDVFLADTSNGRVRRVGMDGVIRTVAGTASGTASGAGGDPLKAVIGFPVSVSVDPVGRVNISDADNALLWQMAADGRSISIVAGNQKFKDVPAGTKAALAYFTRPQGIAIAPDGAVYVAEYTGQKIVKIAADGTASTVIGHGVTSCCNDDGPASQGRIANPAGLAVDRQGALLFADSYNHAIRKVANGIVTRVAGTGPDMFGGPGAFGGDGGPALQAKLNRPWGIAVDGAGNIFFSDNLNHRIRRIATNGVITTIAGDGQAGYAGDGGPAINARLNYPTALAFNPAGDLLFTDTDNNRVRAISTGGTIRTVAGNGNYASTGDGGLATVAAVQSPIGLAVDSAGSYFVTQAYTGVIRRVDANGTIMRFAGLPQFGFSGDGGSPLQANFNEPVGLAVDTAGNLFITDAANDRVRVIRTVTLNTILTPSPVSLTALRGSSAGTPARVSVSSGVTGLPFTPSVAYGPGGTNWLMVTASNTVSPATLTLSADASALAVGRYTATLTVTTNPAGSSNPVSVVLDVTDAAPRLGVSTTSIQVSKVQGAGPDASTLEVRNTGGGTLNYLLAVTASGGANWLTPGKSGGTLPAGQVDTVNVVVNPAGLAAGTYTGALTLTAGEQRAVVAVTLTVRAVQKTILLSQTGLTFTAVANGGTPLAQTLGILNIGNGVLNWSAAARSPWVGLSRRSGSVNTPWLEVSETAVSASAQGLAPGKYYDQIAITGDAENSPQFVTVLLEVLPEGTNPGPEVSPSGMVFVSRQGENPSSQTISINHLGRNAVTYDSGRLGTWYDTAPTAGRTAPNNASRMVVQPQTASLPSGVRRGAVTVQIQEDGNVRTVNLLSVVAPADAGRNAYGRREASSCASAVLRVESTSLREGFTARVGEALRVEVKGTDECGNLLTPLAGGTGAQVSVRPGNGDTQFALAHVGNGVWTGTWLPVRPTASTRLTVVAVFAGTLADFTNGRIQAGKLELSGTVLAQGAASAPLLSAGGVLHAASFEAGVPIAPGSLVTLYGSQLSDGAAQSAALPFPTEVNGTEVRLGDRPLPLLYTSSGQLNAQIPYDVAADRQHQITVRRGDAIAVPETLSVASARPGIFTKAQNGIGQGAITRQDGVTLAEAATPAARGEVIVIYCSGLGPVNQPIVAGRPAPSSPLASVTSPVKVQIGGVEAQVLFAGLSPGYSGLYQVNARVPANAAAGGAVEVTVEVAGQVSRPVTIGVR
ncbi:MAG: SMP-30/gluconolactonase/LRE family protein [Acidobacteria bacterium]|nr:SMP-30/gluconolactonase/LRE family protein [Acidobacteriota bacterium]